MENHKIIVAYDFHDLSHAAMKYAYELARFVNSGILLITVLNDDLLTMSDVFKNEHSDKIKNKITDAMQKEIADTEDKIQASRRFYNSMVLTFNNRTATFPSMLIAGMFNFKKLAFFELDESEKAEVYKPVRVQF